MGAGAISLSDQSALGKYVGGSVVAQIPVYAGAPANIATGPDPTLSIPSTLHVGTDGSLIVPVNLDDPRPAGSTGMTEATLALSYDPAIFSVSSSDIQLGAVPASGSDWSLQSVVDAATGQIGVTLWSSTPITSSAAGSLVTIDFHQSGLVAAGTTTIDLMSSVDPEGLASNGLGVIQTQIDDAHGPYTLTPAPTDAYNPQIDGLVSLAAAAAAVKADPLTAIMHDSRHSPAPDSLALSASSYDPTSAVRGVGVSRLPDAAVLAAVAQGRTVPAYAHGQGGTVAGSTQAKDAVFAALAQPQGGTTQDKAASRESNVWWLLYGQA
jgi:hypothetical protein